VGVAARDRTVAGRITFDVSKLASSERITESGVTNGGSSAVNSDQTLLVFAAFNIITPVISTNIVITTSLNGGIKTSLVFIALTLGADGVERANG